MSQQNAMKNLQFLIILSLENILNLVVANINFQRSQCFSLIAIIRHIGRAYKYKKKSTIFIIYFQCRT
jgi:hypothetical protein